MATGQITTSRQKNKAKNIAKRNNTSAYSHECGLQFGDAIAFGALDAQGGLHPWAASTPERVLEVTEDPRQVVLVLIRKIRVGDMQIAGVPCNDVKRLISLGTQGPTASRVA